MSYEQQIQLKEERLKNALLFFSEVSLSPTVVSKTTAFRNKAKMTVTGTVQEPIIGLTGSDHLDQGRALLDCPIHHPKLNEVIVALPDFIRLFELKPYQIASRTGELKGLILFYSPETNEMSLRFVLRSQECVARIKKLLPKLQAQFPYVTCVSANIQPIPHAILEGPQEIILTEKSYIHHRLGHIVLQFSPQSFVQTNVQVALSLYQTAALWVEQVHPQKMLELYAGLGAFSFFSVGYAQEILSIELNADAVKAANSTAQDLNLKNIRFECVDAASGIKTILEQHNPDLVLVNPPRRGLGDSVKAILVAKPLHFIYSSCSVETLAKDLAVLAEHYQLEKIQIFDLFPHTEHFEILAKLKLR